MIVVLSVMDGFEVELKKHLMSADLHILIQPTSEVAGFDNGFVPQSALDPVALREKIKDKEQVDAFWPVLSTEVILKTGNKVTGVVLKGVTPDRLERLKTQITENAEPNLLVQEDDEGKMIHLPGIFVGQELAYESGIIPGDEVTLISPTETEGPLDAVPRLKKYVVEGVYHSGTPEQELNTVFTTMGAVRSFLRKNDVISQWEVTAKNFDDATKIAHEIKELEPNLKVMDWVQMNSHLFASLRLERISMFIILAFIIVVASFNIVTTLTLMVLEKKKEISILKAMGARHREVASVFLSEGAFIGGIGVGSGILLGFLLCSILRRYEFITLPDVFYDRTLPVSFDPAYYVGVAVCAVLIVLAACVYPSRRAAKMNPLEGIRFG